MAGKIRLNYKLTEMLETAKSLKVGQQNPLAQSQFTALNGNTRIFQLDYYILVQKDDKIGELMTGDPENMYSMAHPYSESRRPTNHQDRLQNLPIASTYIEYHIQNSQITNPKNVRFVYDYYNRLMYVSPSHYDEWVDDDGSKMNPFFFIANHPTLVCGVTQDTLG